MKKIQKKAKQEHTKGASDSQDSQESDNSNLAKIKDEAHSDSESLLDSPYSACGRTGGIGAGGGGSGASCADSAVKMRPIKDENENTSFNCMETNKGALLTMIKSGKSRALAPLSHSATALCYYVVCTYAQVQSAKDAKAAEHKINVEKIKNFSQQLCLIILFKFIKFEEKLVADRVWRVDIQKKEANIITDKLNLRI